jgi:hypothetical protein
VNEEKKDNFVVITVICFLIGAILAAPVKWLVEQIFK